MASLKVISVEDFYTKNEFSNNAETRLIAITEDGDEYTLTDEFGNAIHVGDKKFAAMSARVMARGIRKGSRFWKKTGTHTGK